MTESVGRIKVALGGAIASQRHILSQSRINCTVFTIFLGLMLLLVTFFMLSSYLE